MPVLIPEKPNFKNNKAEEKIWKQLKKDLPADVYLFHGVRITEDNSDKESDLVIIWPNKGIAYIEVKGGYIQAKADGTFVQGSGKKKQSIDPVGQIHGSMYAITNWIHQYTSMKVAHPQTFMVAFPDASLPRSYQNPKIRRSQIIDKDEILSAADRVRNAIETRTGYSISPNGDDCARIADTLKVGIVDETDVASLSTIIDQRSEMVEQYVQENERLLDFVCDVRRFHVKGAAGTGKTALALAQAQRLKRQGLKVAFLCYSKILAASIRHRMEELPKSERIDVVSTFHHLGDVWGVNIPADAVDEFWGEAFGNQFGKIAQSTQLEDKFDAVVIDEAQDFAENWWTVVPLLLRNPDSGGIYAFGDDSQEIFGRKNDALSGLVPLKLQVNLRNADPIAEFSGHISSESSTTLGIVGPDVCLVELPEGTSEYDTIAAGDQVVDYLRDFYQPKHVTLLTTKSRHPIHRALAEADVDRYIRCLWDDSEIFYGTVSGFKGLERNCVVLVVNGVHGNQTLKELLYTGTTRARDLLVIISERSSLEQVFNQTTIQSLRKIEL